MPVILEKDGEDEHTKAEEHFDDKEALMLPVKANKQAKFHKTISSERTRNEWDSVDYHKKKLELEHTPKWAYLQSSMILEDLRAIVFFIWTDVKLLHIVVCMVAIPSEPRSVFPRSKYQN